MKKIYGLFIAVFIAIVGLFTYDYVYPTWNTNVEIDTTLVDTTCVIEDCEVDSLETIEIDSILINTDAVD